MANLLLFFGVIILVYGIAGLFVAYLVDDFSGEIRRLTEVIKTAVVDNLDTSTSTSPQSSRPDAQTDHSHLTPSESHAKSSGTEPTKSPEGVNSHAETDFSEGNEEGCGERDVDGEDTDSTKEQEVQDISDFVQRSETGSSENAASSDEETDIDAGGDDQLSISDFTS